MDKKKLKRRAARRVAATESRAEALVDRLEGFLRRNLHRILKGLERDQLTAKEAANALGGLESALADAGLAQEVGRVRELFRVEYDQVSKDFEDVTGRKALLGKFTRTSLRALEDDRLALAAGLITSYLGDVRSVVMDSVIAGRRVVPEDILDSAQGATFRNLKTEINTALMAYQRITHMKKAEKAGLDLFLYVGPDDKVTRPFCVERVDRIFTREEILRMDNGQGLPVEVYCGGYNCRHHLQPISEELAKALEPQLEIKRERNAERRAAEEAGDE